VELPLTAVRDPDAALEPDGFIVEARGGDRIHFLDWGPSAAGEDLRPLVLAVHGLGQTAWIWSPVARRLGGPGGPARFVAPDLRGHGLSDAPTDDGAYDLDVLAEDVLLVAEAAGLLDRRRLVLAGHGFGAMVSAVAAQRAGGAVSGLVLVDGGWESIETSSGLDVDEFLRGLDEPPEVMASLDAFLADRRDFDPATWDADQERATRATIVETHAGRVVPSARPHATEACVRAMFTYDPIATLGESAVPVVALAAADDEQRSRSIALAEAASVRAGADLDPIEVVRFPHDGHNLMRYRPREVAAAILGLAGPRPT
jgi:pimeloyl-ACP methyl ester carboxylesterase